MTHFGKTALLLPHLKAWLVGKMEEMEQSLNQLVMLGLRISRLQTTCHVVSKLEVQAPLETQTRPRLMEL